MPTSHLDVVGNKPSFAQSTDFLNLDEPPAAKESPSGSQFNLVEEPTANDHSNIYQPQGDRYNNYSYSHHFEQGPREARLLTENNTIARPPVVSGMRRRSTNYIDALNSKAKNQPPSENTGRKNSSPGMDVQDTKHDIGIRDGSSDNCYEGIDMGDKFKRDVPVFKPSYTTEADPGEPIVGSKNAGSPTDADYYRTSFSSRGGGKPELGHRKSSFAYEDFKKDIYDRLNMFDKK